MKKFIILVFLFSVFEVLAETQKSIPDVIWYGGKQTAPVSISTPDQKVRDFGKNSISVWVRSSADCDKLEIKFRAINGAELLAKVEKTISSCKAGDVFKFDVPFQLNAGANASIIADIQFSHLNRSLRSSRAIRISEASAQVQKFSRKNYIQDSDGKLYHDQPATSF